MITRIIQAIYHRNRFAQILILTVCDALRFIRHAGALHQTFKEQQIAAITMAYHVIEKGLTMPNRRLGFGEKAVLQLIQLIDMFSAKYGVSDSTLSYAVGVVREYRKTHLEANFDLPKSLKEQLDAFDKRFPDVSPSAQIHVTREQYYAHRQDAFPLFSASRHSVRHLCGTVSKERLQEALALAQNAPSACNRQHSRVHCICNRDTIKEILTIQGGCRGFGHLADKLLIVTASLHDIRWVEERADLYTNAGIYIMNLCYSLHYYQIAHCILNWSVSPFTDAKLRRYVSLPPEEVVVALIACGDCAEEFNLAASPRKNISQTVRFYD